ncbi:MAG TPA: DUF2252 family protein [Candidatus Acidoferrales bacterium]|nr:DUF2252 family protein [Candidatus Acidoferrales bacterium]
MLMRVSKATRKFENWLSKRTPIVKTDLNLKHRLMREDPFSFLRATFYRWAQTWPDVCPELAKAPIVLAVGDLHVENFGTWRDSEGRLVWGINDFDEAYPMSYANDLVRLAASADLAIKSGHLKISNARACKTILGGYIAGLRAGGIPFVLEENHNWLRRAATGELRNPVHFWAKLDKLATVSNIPKSAKRALESLLPEDHYRIVHRVAGVGSLGGERFVALSTWKGGRIAREAKALTPSAYIWGADQKGSDKILYEEIIESACRAIDPLVRVRGRWLLRRLSPDCSRIELTQLPKKIDEERLLWAMGFETANVHLGSESAVNNVRRDVSRRKPDWLHSAMKKMTHSVLEDYEDWCKSGP